MEIIGEQPAELPVEEVLPSAVILSGEEVTHDGKQYFRMIDDDMLHRVDYNASGVGTWTVIDQETGKTHQHPWGMRGTPKTDE